MFPPVASAVATTDLMLCDFQETIGVLLRTYFISLVCAGIALLSSFVAYFQIHGFTFSTFDI